MQQFDKAVFVVGATATGKTALAHLLSERLEEHGQICELVNLDAFQFYQGLSAGTAKPTALERLRYRYHGIDFLTPLESIDAARYAEYVWERCRTIAKQGHLPLCVGGSGLYLRSVLHGLDPLPPRNDALRQMFRASAEAWQWPELHRWLSVLDPERAAQLHPHDKTRIERALEIVFQLAEGVSTQSLFTKSKKLSEQNDVGQTFIIHVDCGDSVLKSRISARIDAMFALGWLEEVIALRSQFADGLVDRQCFKALGYREIWAWLESCEGQQDLGSKGIVQGREACAQTLRERIATLTWQYVRRQRTWNAKERCDWAVDTTKWSPASLSWSDAFDAFLNK